jgi:riboflavin kinase/FMN adenylyltransferase
VFEVKRLRGLEAAAGELTRSVVVVGNFDALHLGHRSLIARARELADGLGAEVVALTFDPHPVRYFKPDADPFLLTTIDQRFDLFEAAGVDAAVALEFDDALSHRSPEAFVQEILADALASAHVLVGQGWRFGYKRAGDTDALERLCAERGVGVTVMPPLEMLGALASSTRVRELARAGEVDRIPALTGIPLQLEGPVVHGDARGRTLGYPTANIAVGNELIPADGIYVATLSTEEHGDLPACAYIGSRPTFYEDGARVLEVFVIEHDGPLDLYGAFARVALHARVREDRAYEGPEALRARMDLDVASARAWFLARG